MTFLYDLSLKRNNTYQNHQEFFSRFGGFSYRQWEQLDKVFIYNNARFHAEVTTGNKTWRYANLNSLINLWKLGREIRKTNSTVWLNGFRPTINTLIFMRFFVPSGSVIVQHHGEPVSSHPLKRLLQRWCFSAAGSYAFVSARQAKPFISAGIVRKAAPILEVMECSTTFSPIDKKTARKDLDMGSELVLLFVGRLNANKDPLLMIDAFCKSTIRNKAHLYMIYGTNDLEEDARKKIAHFGAENRITLVGSVPNEDMPQWFSAADYIISCSHQEAGGIAICEAMACGCVPVVTAIPSFQNMMPKHWPLMFQPEDADALAKIMDGLSIDEIAKQRTEVMEQFESELSFPAIGKKIKSWIERSSHQP